MVACLFLNVNVAKLAIDALTGQVGSVEKHLMSGKACRALSLLWPICLSFSFSRNSFQTSRGVSVHIVRWHLLLEAILSCEPPTVPRKSCRPAHPSLAGPPLALLSRRM